MRRLLPTAKTTLHPAYDPAGKKVLAFQPAIRRPHPLSDRRARKAELQLATTLRALDLEAVQQLRDLRTRFHIDIMIGFNHPNTGAAYEHFHELRL